VKSPKAYKFGTLIDAVITEPQSRLFQISSWWVQYSEEDFESYLMKRLLWRDPSAKFTQTKWYTKGNDYQQNIHDEVEFELPVRCKWDLWMDGLKWGGDLKAATATTQKTIWSSTVFWLW
jgi:hypothetical protein